MADYINNVAAGDQYTDACTLGPTFSATYAVITIANASALMQFAVGKIGDWRWTDEREYQSIPQSFRVGGIIGVRIRNAQPGVVARVLVVLAGPNDLEFQSGLPFTGVLSAGGGVSPGAGSVEIDHNGVAISTEPKLDFEDDGALAWTISDDPANTRAKISLPKVITGRVNADGTIAAGTGFAVNHTGTGKYTVTFGAAFPNVPTVTAVCVDAAGATVGIELDSVAADGFNATTFTTVPADSDRGWNFIAIATA